MSEHPLVSLARQTVETYVKEGKVIAPPKEPTAEMKEKAGVFVSLHRKGHLRGCIGTFAPTTESVAKEVIRNAIEAATRDPRFPPVKAEELADLEISVDVLTDPVAVGSERELDAKKYGVIVKSGPRRGLLLPDLPGVNTPQEQIAICRQKAWIDENEPVELFKFEVRRYH
ncbi:MAG: AmmeMemoRadiSam system protein A [Candidatus Margulisbacteria bacterium]|nr:AmmeMemoRadiSam system protein A [Candidatus Margulisiibacteriota bacterium]